MSATALGHRAFEAAQSRAAACNPRVAAQSAPRQQHRHVLNCRHGRGLCRLGLLQLNRRRLHLGGQRNHRRPYLLRRGFARRAMRSASEIAIVWRKHTLRCLLHLRDGSYPCAKRMDRNTKTESRSSSDGRDKIHCKVYSTANSFSSIATKSLFICSKRSSSCTAISVMGNVDISTSLLPSPFVSASLFPIFV